MKKSQCSLQARLDNGSVIPKAIHSVIDMDVAKRMMDATEPGCEILAHGVQRDGSPYNSRDLSFAMAFGYLGDPTIPGYTAVIGYLPFPYSFSAFSRGRFWLETLKEIPTGWLARGRHNWKWEIGDLEIEIRPIDDIATLRDIAAFKAGLDDEWRSEIQCRLKSLGSPQCL